MDETAVEAVPATEHVAEPVTQHELEATAVQPEKAEPNAVVDEEHEHEDDDFETPPTTGAPSTPTHTGRPASVRISTSFDNHYSSSPQQRSPSPVSPMSEKDAYHISRDSMASIALSETSLDYENLSTEQVTDMLATPRVSGIRHRRKPSSLDILQNNWAPPDRQSTLFDTAKDGQLERTMSAVEADRDVWSRHSLDFGAPRPVKVDKHVAVDSVAMIDAGLEGEGGFSSSDTTRPGSGSSTYSDDAQVNWQKLDATEEQEKEDKDIPAGAEDESTAFLLARLEQENAKFTLDPKSTVSKVIQRARAASRPPSMAHLKKLVSGLEPPTIRYSLAPDDNASEEPPPMTELEFWTALVQDYISTAVRLPTLTTSKIRAGIPPPLRGVVWTSMAGARDAHLEEAFERLVHEKSSYEGIINKDVGRSFPGVELFRDADGEGQRMLGRVLKCFSLQDKDIGYCQGLGFLVGPLLMNMGEQEAFCVLVRLMEHYALRPSFLPSLSGLHMRIFQFSSLLRQHNQKLHEHLGELGVEPAYLSQWFLSCFAVTCPLPMLFRIYDVIFAEGANETVMRVALALMRRHEETILNTNEFEDVMQLLLGREIWDCYGGDADELVDDFTSIGDIVTHGRLSELEREFENQSSETVGQSAGFLPDVQAAASRFLGRLWAPGHMNTPSRSASGGHAPKASFSMLSPPSAEKEGSSAGMSLFARPGSFLRRSPSRTNISLNESNGSDDSTSTIGSGSASLASTAPTEIDGGGAVRESVADSLISSKSMVPQTPGASNREQQELHGQIEDLLTALSEMQREHAQLAAMLQREREERSEDHRAMRRLVGKFRKAEKDDRRRTMPAQSRIQLEANTKGRPLSVGNQRDVPVEAAKPKDEMEELVDKIQERLATNVRYSGNLETKAQLRSALARTREQLALAQTQSKDLTIRVDAAEASVNVYQAESDEFRAEAQELRSRVADEFKAKQKLEYEITELRAQARTIERKSRMAMAESLAETPLPRRTGSISESRMRSGSVSSMPVGSVANTGGLRELKLGRRDSTSSIQSLRIRRRSTMVQTEQSAPASPPRSETPSPADEPPSPSVVITFDDTPSPARAPPPAGSSLGVPAIGFAPRSTSLAAKEVFASPEHEPIPDEALLLELVNSKTAEAQARQEIDELRRALTVGKRRQGEALQQMRAEMDAARVQSALALEAAMTEAAHAVEAARASRLEVEAMKYRDASTVSTPIFSLPPTPYLDDGANNDSGKSTPVTTPQEERSLDVLTAKKADPAPAAVGGGWFWSRRTASRNNISTPPKEGTMDG